MVRGIETQNVALSASDRPPVPRPEPMLEPPDPSEAEQVWYVDCCSCAANIFDWNFVKSFATKYFYVVAVLPNPFQEWGYVENINCTLLFVSH